MGEMEDYYSDEKNGGKAYAQMRAAERETKARNKRDEEARKSQLKKGEAKKQNKETTEDHNIIGVIGLIIFVGWILISPIDTGEPLQIGIKIAATIAMFFLLKKFWKELLGLSIVAIIIYVGFFK